MQKVRPVYIKLLIAAVIIFVIGVSAMLCDVYERVGELEHNMVHLGGKCPLKHVK